MLVIVWHARRAANPTILQKVYVFCRENDKRQEFMILPVGAKSFKEALCIGCEVGFFSDLAKGCWVLEKA